MSDTQWYRPALMLSVIKVPIFYLSIQQFNSVWMILSGRSTTKTSFHHETEWLNIFSVAFRQQQERRNIHVHTLHRLFRLACLCFDFMFLSFFCTHAKNSMPSLLWNSIMSANYEEPKLSLWLFNRKTLSLADSVSVSFDTVLPSHSPSP